MSKKDQESLDQFEERDAEARERAEAEDDQRLKEEDDIFDQMAASYEVNGNLDNLPRDFSASNSDSDEEEPNDEPEDDDDGGKDEPREPAADDSPDSDSDSGDIWEGATEAQRREFERLEHADRSQRGRVSALTRQVDDLRRQLAEAQQRAAPAPQADAEDVDDDTMKQFAEDYPEIAQAMNAMQSRNEKLLNKLESQLQGVSTVVSPIAQREADEAKRDEWNRLMEAHPDAETISADPKFHEWASKHHRQEIRLMYGSDYADSNIDLLRIYKEENNIPSAKPGNRRRTEADNSDDDRLSDMEGLGGGRGGPRRTSRSDRGNSEDDLFESLAERHAKTGKI